jgi:hypothetical protein
MCGAILALPQYVFMAWCLVKHGDYLMRYKDQLFLSMGSVNSFAVIQGQAIGAVCFCC